MYIRPEQIAEQYEMEVKSISKGRDCFLCETDLGMRALKEYRWVFLLWISDVSG